MKGSTGLKGSHSIKTMQSLKKDAEFKGENRDFLKLYMLEKERTRLRSEQKRLELRLEPIMERLKEIDAYYVETLGSKMDGVDDQITDQEEDKIQWRTVGISY